MSNTTSALRTVRFKATNWSCEETDGHELVIHLSGLTKDQKTVQVKVEGFTPFVYLELPSRVKWNPTKCKAVFQYFQKAMKAEGPIRYKMYAKERLHYKKPVNTMFMSFPTGGACRKFGNKCIRSRSIHIPGAGTFSGGEFKVHEQNIDPVIKFTAAKKIHLAGWLEVKEKIPDDEAELSVEERKYSSADIDLYADWRRVNPYEMKSDEGMVVVQPKYCSFDIECNSKNHNSKLPNADEPKNCVFQIAMIFGRMGDREGSKRKVLLSMFNPHDIPETEVIRCRNEKELLLTFTALIKAEDPDIFIGYNIMKFDWDYMIERAEKYGFYPRFMELSRIIGKRAELKKSSWSSSAYGEQSFRFPNCHGRTNVDVLLEVERNFRLPTYSLNAVSEFFLKDKKDDISPRQLFMLFQITDEILPQVKDRNPTLRELKQIRRRVLDIFPLRKTHGVVRELRRQLLKAKPSEIKDLIREALTITGRYCVQDTVLPIDLAEKLNLWTTMEEMANVMHVPASYLHTRGQQIKVLAQVYRETIFNNIIIPYSMKKDSDEKYQGAIVIEANPGDYNNVGTLDFASLYPTTMIAFNICYTTILEDSDPTPDSECHVLEWEDHVGCPHDPQKRKKKKEDVMCAKHRYRFRKVKIHYNEKTGEIVREHEGLMPRLERNLLATRKVVKKEMFKAEARLKMQRGQATDGDLKYFTKVGYEIIEPGSLGENEEMMLEVMVGVLNAKQLAIKVSANSCYGAMGAKTGFIPLIPGAASVTAMGRRLIMMAIDKIRGTWTNCKLVYGDTDSCMIVFEGASLEQSFDLCEKASKVSTHYLKCWILGVDEEFVVTTRAGVHYTLNKIDSKSDDFQNLNHDDKIKVLEYEAIPIDLEFENMYGRFLLLTKKRYVAYIVNRKGEVVGTVKKGVVLARRDNSEYLRITYKKMTDGVLDEKDEGEVMGILYDRVNKLFTRQIPDTQLIIYTGVKNVMSYATKKEKKDGRNVIDVYYLDENGDPIDDPVGPLDPRLVYKNYPQALLSLKMMRRGTDIPPNTRLEYLYIENPEAEHQGEKAEDYTYYRENRDVDNLHPDFLHYIEKQLTNPITELLAVKYPREPVIYEKLDDALMRVLSSRDISELKQSRIVKTRRLAKPRSEGYTPADGAAIGWSALEEDIGEEIEGWEEFVEAQRSSHRKSKERKTFTEYSYSGNEARAMMVLESAKRGSMTDFNPNNPVEAEIIDVCRRWKARAVLDKIYSENGLKKRPAKRPTQTGDKLRTNTQVILLHSLKGQPKHAIGKVIDVHEDDTGRKKRYTFDLLMDEVSETIIHNIPRDALATFYLRDSTVMKDILRARTYYRQTTDHLKELFNPVRFRDE